MASGIEGCAQQHDGTRHVDMLAKNEEDLQSQVTSVHEDSKRYGLQMNKKKTN